MPLKNLNKLVKLSHDLNIYKQMFADIPSSLARCEAHGKIFQKTKENIEELIPRIFELKGISAGLALAAKEAEQHKMIVRAELEKDEIEEEEAKRHIARISAVQDSIRDTIQNQTAEFQRSTGRYDGLLIAAKESLEAIGTALQLHQRHLDTEKEEDEYRKSRKVRKPKKKAAKKKTAKKKAKAKSKSNGQDKPASPAPETASQTG